MNLIQTSVIIAILCFTVQMIANVKSDKKIIKWLPVIILAVAFVCNLIYWYTGIGTYDHNDIISGREADAMCQAVILGAGLAGCAAAWILSFLYRKTGK